MRAHIWSYYIHHLICSLFLLSSWGCEDNPPQLPNTDLVSANPTMNPNSMTPAGGAQPTTGGRPWDPSAGMSMPQAGEVTPIQPSGEMMIMMECQSACDCTAGMNCREGRCVQESQPVYCCNQANCPSDAMCVNPNGQLGTCGGCLSVCDCALGQACQEGRCVAVNDGLVPLCCERAPCPVGDRCETVTGELSECTASCRTACECVAGLSCVDGACIRLDEPSFCCERPLCPQGQVCEQSDGEMGVCPETPCTSACDCPSSQSCIDGSCVLSTPLTYCCVDPDCPSGARCESSNGVEGTCQSNVECQSACDCLPGFACDSGRCISHENGPVFCCGSPECLGMFPCDDPTGNRSSCDRATME